MDINERMARAERQIELQSGILEHQAQQIEHQAGILKLLGQMLTHLVEKDKHVLASIDTLTQSVNNFMAAAAAVRENDQAVIAADQAQIVVLQNHVVPDELIQKLDAATAALTASLPKPGDDGTEAAGTESTGTEGTVTGATAPSDTEGATTS